MFFFSFLFSNELVPMAENSLFQNLSFNPFNFESILLNNNQDPDENLTENFNNCSYFTPDELKNSIEMIPLKGFSFIRNHDFLLFHLLKLGVLMILGMKLYTNLIIIQVYIKRVMMIGIFVHNLLTFNKR